MNSSSTDHRRFRLGQAAAGWFRDSFRYRGVWRTAGIFSTRVFEFVRDLSPSRRRLRYGDLQFDFDHAVDTTWSNVGLGTRIRELFSGEAYQPIESDQFHDMVDSLGIDFRNFTFIDLGSGKGRALLLASDYPFRRIIGVEILPELHSIAERNIQKYRSGEQQCNQITSWCGDARDFEFPVEPTLLYLFNPFFEPVLQAVLNNIEISLRANPREFVLLYVNPISEHLVQKTSFLHKVDGTHQYAVYGADLQAKPGQLI